MFYEGGARGVNFFPCLVLKVARCTKGKEGKGRGDKGGPGPAPKKKKKQKREKETGCCFE